MKRFIVIAVFLVAVAGFAVVKMHEAMMLRDAGVTVMEKTLTYADFESADEIFATGNASKVLPVTRIGERALQPGPLYRRARELYWAFAHNS
jgi:branched-chain amino acid aminotransferase